MLQKSSVNAKITQTMQARAHIPPPPYTTSVYILSPILSPLKLYIDAINERPSEIDIG